MSAATIVPDVETEPDPPSRSRRWLRLILVGVVLLGLVGGAAAWWLLVRDAPSDAAPEDGEIVTLEPLTTTLGEAALRHARVTLAIVLVEGEDPAVVDARAPELRDALLREVATMDGDELRSSVGSEAVRRTLTEDAKTIWGDDVVQRVLLTELLVQ